METDDSSVMSVILLPGDQTACNGTPKPDIELKSVDLRLLLCFRSQIKRVDNEGRYRQGHGTWSEKRGSTNRKGIQQKRRRLGSLRSCDNCFHAGYSPVFFIHLDGSLSSSVCRVIYHNSLVSGISKNFKIKHCETVSLSVVISAASDVCTKV